MNCKSYEKYLGDGISIPVFWLGAHFDLGDGCAQGTLLSLILRTMQAEPSCKAFFTKRVQALEQQGLVKVFIADRAVLLTLDFRNTHDNLVPELPILAIMFIIL